MPVHPKAEEMWAKTQSMNAVDVLLLDPADARKEDARVTAAFLSTPEPVRRVENQLIEEGSSRIPARIYWPKQNAVQVETELYPIIVFFHGGGWVLGNLDLYDELCSMLCNRAEAIVLSIDYALAPEHKFPAPLNDCYAATKWAATHAQYLEGDADSIVVAGDSAGGNLAAAVCLMAKQKGGPQIAMQVLIYPITDLLADLSKYSKDKFGPSKEAMEWFIGHYVGAADMKNPLTSTVYGDLSGLPPAIIVTAEHDPLRDQDLEYAKKLEQAGVKMQLLDFPGMVHGFVQLPSFFDAGKEAIQKIAAEIDKLYVENPA